MTSKTIVLTGKEIRVEYSGGCNAWLRNDGTAAVYASASAGITAGADGTVSIPAGKGAVIYGANGSVYLKGTGSVQLVGSDYSECPFYDSAASGGSGADEQARAAIEAHAGNTAIHVTVAEKSTWNGKAEKIGDNLLDNPDFAVNQRGAAGTISSLGYFVDRWKLINGSVTVNADNTLTLDGTIAQILEKAAGTDVTASASTGTASYDDSAKTFTITASGETISWAKLESGSAATPFVPPEPTAELAKCRRYFRTISRGAAAYCVNAESVIFRMPFETPMRADPANVVILNDKPVLTYSSGWIAEPENMQVVSVNISRYGLCYLHVNGFDLTVGGTAFEPNYAFALATDNVFGISADL